MTGHGRRGAKKGEMVEQQGSIGPSASFEFVLFFYSTLNYGSEHSTNTFLKMKPNRNGV